ncbi:MAG TPA: hypothetical protein VGX68_17910 [Thermoanaerobaculia bacterium]|jgi:hypothetical protein|nr:hypothetical protein [Thermoanaerobaculia bacterium]
MSRSQVVNVEGAASRGADPQGPIVQKLKAERVQEPVATLRTRLKAERVQEDLAAAGGAPAQPAFVFEVTVELSAAKVAITFHGDPAVVDAG